MIEEGTTDPRDFSFTKKDGFDFRMRAALRFKDWKIITGPPCSGSRCGVQTDTRNYGKPEELVSNERGVRLYNITADPREAFDLSDKHPWITKQLLLKLCKYHVSQKCP